MGTRLNKKYKTKEELAAIILGSSWLINHTKDEKARLEYKLKNVTAKQDYFIVTGHEYKPCCLDNKYHFEGGENE